MNNNLRYFLKKLVQNGLGRSTDQLHIFMEQQEIGAKIACMLGDKT